MSIHRNEVKSVMTNYYLSTNNSKLTRIIKSIIPISLIPYIPLIPHPHSSPNY